MYTRGFLALIDLVGETNAVVIIVASAILMAVMVIYWKLSE